MNTIFAREPVFTIKKTLFAYQFMYNNASNGSFPADFSGASLHEPQTLGLNIDDLLQLNMTIVNLLPESLVDFADTFSPNGVIIEISELKNKPTTEVIEQIKVLKQTGFGLIGNQDQLNWPEFIKMVNYVKIDINNCTPHDLINLKDELDKKQIKIIATQVNSHAQFMQCEKIGVQFVQGYFFLEKEETNEKPIPSSKFAYMQLMTEIAKPELDSAHLEDIFQKDPTLSFLLIKFINNPLINKSHKITSIRHALNYLGELMIRRFVAIISIAGLNTNKPNELLNLSLSRAKYCELLDAELNPKSERMSAFLVGLFSLLDIILGKNIAELLATLELEESITNALVNQEGHYASLLATAKNLETGNWNTLLQNASQIGRSKEQLFEVYRQSVRWQHDITSAISPSFPVAKTKSQAAAI